MAFPTQNVHLDPDYYNDPQLFNAFRFSRPFEGAVSTGDWESELNTTITLMSWEVVCCPDNEAGTGEVKLLGELIKRRASQHNGASDEDADQDQEEGVISCKQCSPIYVTRYVQAEVVFSAASSRLLGPCGLLN